MVEVSPSCCATIDIEENRTLRGLEEDYDITGKLQDQAEKLPSKIGDGLLRFSAAVEYGGYDVLVHAALRTAREEFPGRANESAEPNVPLVTGSTDPLARAPLSGEAGRCAI